MTEVNQTVRNVGIPERMRNRPVDRRGWPIPWFVVHKDEHGDADFRVVPQTRVSEAIRKQLCWVCGTRLGGNYTFVIGPMCVINRISAEPPVHRECGEWSVKVCPFMTKPKMVRNEFDLPEDRAPAPGIMFKRNPGVICVWETRYDGYKVIRDGNRGHLFRLFADPLHVSFYAEGRTATLAEIERSVVTGLPALKALAENEGPSAIREFQKNVKKAQGYFYPVENVT